MKFSPLLIFSVLLFLACSGDDSPVVLPDDGPSGDDMTMDDPDLPNAAPCIDGMAGIYPCDGYDLLGRLPLADLNANEGNDIWGWTDPDTGSEYALVGLSNGTAFVDISDTDNLVYLGKLPTQTSASTWRDIKVYQNHAFVVSEAINHGMQVFDLTRLRDVSTSPANFTADAVFDGFGNCHNLVINEDTGFAYGVGTARNDQFRGGVHFVDISDPKNPVAAGGYGDNGYTHDGQVVNYNGPDTDYTGREIFVGANENQVVIADFTDKGSPRFIASLGYSNIAYTHQGWFTEDHRYFILGDELDEIDFGFNSRTLIFDFTDLDNPVLHTTYSGPTTAIDHNGYILGDRFFLANYTAGLRVLDVSGIDAEQVVESGYFDTFPGNDSPSFDGVWSVYPYFASGKIAVNDINTGLFILEESN